MKVNLLIVTNDSFSPWCYCHTNACSLNMYMSCVCNRSDCVIFVFFLLYSRHRLIIIMAYSSSIVSFNKPIIQFVTFFFL